MIVFRVGVKDAKFLAEEMGSSMEPEDLENMKNYHAVVKTLIDGEVYPAFTIKTLLSPTSTDSSVAAKVRELSLSKYGRPKFTVEQEIKDRLNRLKNGVDLKAQIKS